MRATVALSAALMIVGLLGGGRAAGAGLFDTTQYYVVQPGDTLYSLAKRSGTTVAQLRELNGIGPDALIRVGQRLRIPGGKTAALVPSPAPGPGEAKTYAVVLPVAEAGRVEKSAVDAGTPAPAAGPQGPVPPATDETPAAPPELATPRKTVIPITEEERLLLARLVVAEAGNEPLEGQVAVAAVVVNRVRHPSFPKSVTAVIREPGQFKAVELGRLETVVAGPTALAAVDRALSGEDPTKGALFFYNPVKSVALDFWRTRPVTAVIGGHNFAR